MLSMKLRNIKMAGNRAVRAGNPSLVFAKLA